MLHLGHLSLRKKFIGSIGALLLIAVVIIIVSIFQMRQQSRFIAGLYSQTQSMDWLGQTLSYKADVTQAAWSIHSFYATGNVGEYAKDLTLGISQSIGEIYSHSKHVTEAATEQKRGIAQIEIAVSDMNNSAIDSQNAIQNITNLSSELVNQKQNLVTVAQGLESMAFGSSG